MSDQPEVPASASTEFRALYSALTKEVRDSTMIVHRELEATLQEVRADRREREATLTVVVSSVVREAFADALPALRAEFDASIKALYARAEEESRSREALESVVALKVDRRDSDAALDKAVARVETEIDSEIRGPSGIEPRVRVLELEPRKRRREWVFALGGIVATAIVGYIVDRLKGGS